MKTVQVKIKGISPLLQHRLDEKIFAEEQASARRRKTSEIPDPAKYVYQLEDGTYYVPAIWIKGTLLSAASQFIWDKKRTWKRPMASVSIEPIHIPLKPQKWSPDYQVGRNRNTGGRIVVARPRFDNWSLEFNLSLDDGMPADKLQEILEYAGKYEGIGSFRPNCSGHFGRFEVVQFEENNN